MRAEMGINISYVEFSISRTVSCPCTVVANNFFWKNNVALVLLALLLNMQSMNIFEFYKISTEKITWHVLKLSN